MTHHQLTALILGIGGSVSYAVLSLSAAVRREPALSVIFGVLSVVAVLAADVTA